MCIHEGKEYHKFNLHGETNQKKYLEKNRCLYQAFIDLEKAYDRVPREVIYWGLRKKLVPVKLIQVVKATYEGACTTVRTCKGVSEEFDIKVGLHQGLVLSPFLFAIVIDVLSNDVRKGAPWKLLFADDLAITAETEELQERVVEWQRSMESGGLRMNAEKYEVVLGRRDGPVNGGIQNARGKHLAQKHKFKYLGSVICSKGGCTEAVKDGWK